MPSPLKSKARPGNAHALALIRWPHSHHFFHSSTTSALGAQAPLGMFDPLGIMADGSQERFDVWREVEM